MVAIHFPIWRKNSLSKVVLGISRACVAGFYYQIQLSYNRNTIAHRLEVSFNISTYHVGTLDWHHCPPCLLLLWSLQAYPRLLLQMTACQATSFVRSERTYQATSFCNKTSIYFGRIAIYHANRRVLDPKPTLTRCHVILIFEID